MRINTRIEPCFTCIVLAPRRATRVIRDRLLALVLKTIYTRMQLNCGWRNVETASANKASLGTSQRATYSSSQVAVATHFCIILPFQPMTVSPNGIPTPDTDRRSLHALALSASAYLGHFHVERYHPKKRLLVVWAKSIYSHNAHRRKVCFRYQA